jgi:CRP-like cAMP-binding protein
MESSLGVFRNTMVGITEGEVVAMDERHAEDAKRVRVLDLDPELAASVPEEELSLAASNFVAELVEADSGEWDPSGCTPPDCIGLLVLEGLVTRNVGVAGLFSRELLGAGDVLRPWDVEDEDYPLEVESGWTVLEPLRLAVLDQHALKLGVRWPRLVDAILHRVLHRSRWLAVRLAIASTTKIDERLLLFFWHAAGRWGRVTPEGLVVPFDLTHEELAEIVGARRPSVTTALGQLHDAGRLERRDGEWILFGDPPRELVPGGLAGGAS